MVQLRIKPLYDAAWKIFGFQYDQCVADRNRFLAKLRRRLGHEMAAKIQNHVDISLGRVLAIPDHRDPKMMTTPEFYELWSIEKTVEDIEMRIDANATFYDPTGGLLPTLGLSWRQDVLRLLDGQVSPGYMPLKNIRQFLSMVRDAKQWIKGEDGKDKDVVNFYRKRRWELIEFLQRAVLVGEPLFCDVQ